MPTPTSRFGIGLLASTFVASVLLAGGPWAGVAHACSCAQAPLKDEIDRSDAVFSGEVRGIEEGVTPDGALSGTVGGTEATGKVSFAVQDSWKGVTTETVEVYGQGDGVNCYIVFEEGKSYIVYASRGEAAGGSAPLEDNECGATKPLADAERDLRVLGSPPSTLPDTGGPPLAGALVAAAFLACAGVLCRVAGGP